MTKRIGILVLMIILTATCFAFAEANETSGAVSNPWIGVWDSYIPSADMTITFDYKEDGTFTYEMSGVPAEQGGVGEGAYLVYGDKMVTWMDFEGAGAYRFVVEDENTIQVTEITVENGELVTEIPRFSPVCKQKIKVPVF